MILSEAVTEVINIVKRPDKITEAAFQLNRAISFFTLKGEFSDDLVESTLSIDPASYGQVVDISSLTRFRKFAYVQPTGKRYYIAETNADKILVPGGSVQPNKYFLAGTNLTITLSELTPTLEVGYYRYPAVLTSPETNWMLTKHPYMLIEYAASRIFNSVGDETSAAMYEKSALEYYKTMRADTAK